MKFPISKNPSFFRHFFIWVKENKMILHHWACHASWQIIPLINIKTKHIDMFIRKIFSFFFHIYWHVKWPHFFQEASRTSFHCTLKILEGTHKSIACILNKCALWRDCMRHYSWPPLCLWSSVLSLNQIILDDYKLLYSNALTPCNAERLSGFQKCRMCRIPSCLYEYLQRQR